MSLKHLLKMWLFFSFGTLAGWRFQHLHHLQVTHGELARTFQNVQEHLATVPLEFKQIFNLWVNAKLSSQRILLCFEDVLNDPRQRGISRVFQIWVPLPWLKAHPHLYRIHSKGRPAWKTPKGLRMGVVGTFLMSIGLWCVQNLCWLSLAVIISEVFVMAAMPNAWFEPPVIVEDLVLFRWGVEDLEKFHGNDTVSTRYNLERFQFAKTMKKHGVWICFSFTYW